jgi:hypothetical protein
MENETKNELITGGQELIALYMGLPVNHQYGLEVQLPPDNPSKNGYWTRPRYNESWDWLMPVVHKIVKTELPEKRGWSYEYLQLESTRIGNSIDYVYMKVVEFLKHKSRGGGN